MDSLTARLIKYANPNLDKDFTGKYYLALGFDDKPLNEKHITVVYFAEQSNDDVGKIMDIVDGFIEEKGFDAFDINFDKIEMFGPDKDIKVTRPGTPKADSPLYLPELKDRLYPFNKSSFKDAPYKPHVTSDDDKETGKVTKLVLASGDKVIKKWDANMKKSAKIHTEMASASSDHTFGGGDAQDTNENAAPWDLNQGTTPKEDEMKKRAMEILKGGLADNKPDSKYDKDQMKKGLKVEMEHTNSKAKAKEIVKDHLEEEPKYYSHLEKMEEGFKKKAGWHS